MHDKINSNAICPNHVSYAGNDTYFWSKDIFWTVLEISRLEMTQISSNLLKKAFTTLTACLSFHYYGRVLRQFCSGIRKDLNFDSLGFSVFFAISYFSFSYLFTAVIVLLLGLLFAKKNFREASSRRAIFAME